MQIFKKMVRGLLDPIFMLLLLALSFTVGVLVIFGQASNIKQTLSDSGLYGSAFTAALQTADEKTGKKDSINLLDPSIKQAAEQTLTADFLQSSTEEFINGTFNWLEGKTLKPDFKIDLSDKKEIFANLVAERAKTVAGKLPTCTTPVNIKNYDPFTANCLPQDLSPNQIKANVKKELLNHKEFLAEPIITADTLKAENSNQSIFESNLKQAPEYFQWAQRTPYSLAILLVIIAGVTILLSAHWSIGLRRVGISLLLAAILLLIISWLLKFGIIDKAVPNIKIPSEVLDDNLSDLITNLVSQINRVHWWVSGIYALLGTAAVIVGETFRRHYKKMQLNL